MENITLVKNGKCEGCPCFKADIVEDVCYVGNATWQNVQTVVCENEALCNRIEKYLIEKMSVE